MKRIIPQSFLLPLAQLFLFGGLQAAAGSQVRVAGNLVYLLNSQSNLVVFDVSNATNPVPLSTFTSYAGVGPPALFGSCEALLPGGGGLIILDMSNPSSLGYLGTYPTSLPNLAVQVSGSIGCVAESGGLELIDLTGPDQFQSLSWPGTPSAVLDLALSSNLVYAACGTAGLEIMDMSSPLNPIPVGYYTTTGAVQRVVADGVFAYLLCDGARLEIVNVGNPAAPQLAGSYATAGGQADLDIAANFAFLASTNGTLSTLNVSNRASPFLQSTNPVAGGALGVRVVGNNAYVRNGAGNLVVVPLAGFAPAAPRVVDPVQPLTALVGDTAVMSVVVEGTPPLTYRWEKDGVPLTNGVRITGSAGPCLKVSSLGMSDTGEYSIAVTNAVGTVISSNLVLVVTPGTPVEEGNFGVQGSALGLQAVDQSVYVAAGTNGLVIESVSDPRWPLGVYSASTPGVAYGVRTLGQYAFLALGPAGLQVLDLDNPGLSALVASNAYGCAYGLDVVGGMVYVADGSNGLQVVDATTPLAPVLQGGYDTPGTAYAVQVAGGLAYVADGSSGLQILSVTNPAVVVPVGSYGAAGVARGVSVVGTTAYVADGTGGLLVLDVSNPASPSLLGRYSTRGPAMGVEVVQAMALLAESTNGVEVVSVANPTNIVSLGSDNSATNALALSLSGTTVYVAAGVNGVKILNLAGLMATNPVIQTNPVNATVVVGQPVTFHVGVTGDQPLSFQWFKDGNPVFQTSATLGVASDTLSLTNPGLADSGTYSVVVRNGWNLAATAQVQLQVVLLGTPVFQSAYTDTLDVLDVQVAGELAYVASRLGGLEVINCHNVLNPVKVGGLATSGFAQQVCLAGNLAYTAVWDGGLDIFDVFDPTNVVRIGHVDTPGLARGVDVSGSLAYVADSQGGLCVFDVTDPTRPLSLGSTPTDGFAFGVKVAGTTAYVAAGQAGLEIFDVSEPLAVKRIGGLATPGTAEKLALAGNLVYLAISDAGLQIIDVSNPAGPQKVGEIQTVGDAFCVQVISNLAYVAEGIGKASVVNVTNPAQPVLSLSGEAGISVHGLQVVGNLAFLADRLTGLVVAQCLGLSPLAPTIVQQPNTIAGTTGSNQVISVSVEGTPPLTFQWYKGSQALTNSTLIQGVNTLNLSLQNLGTTNAGNYSLFVTNAWGAAVSSNILLTVSSPGSPPVPPAVLVQPTNQTAIQGAAVDFITVVSGTAPLDCRWYFNGQPVFDDADISGSGSAHLHISNLQREYAGSYQLLLWNHAGVTNSQAAVLSYTGPLQSQINSATPGQVISLPAGTYGETLSIGKNLTLVGTDPATTILDGLGLGTILHVLPGASVTVDGIGFRNGSATNDQGGAIKNEGQLTLNDCVLGDCIAGSGGGLANLQFAMIEYCSISNNQAIGSGGGIFNGQQATLEIINSMVSSNTAANGAGVFTSGNLFATNCAAVGNLASGAFGTSDGNGAGLQCLGGQTWLVNSTISGNQALAYTLSPGGGAGGGLRLDGGALYLMSSTVSSNIAADAGGGVLVDSNGVASVRNTIISGNWAAGIADDFDGTLFSEGYNLLQTIARATITGDTNGNLLGLDPLLGPLQDNGGPTWTHALLASSPAVDAGACDSPLTDQRGVARPFDIPWVPNVAGGCDIGAFELVDLRPYLVVSGRSSGGFTLSWQGMGVLQNAHTPSGPWQDTAGSSPFAVSFHDSNVSFFRVRQTNSPLLLTISQQTPDGVSLPLAAPAGFLPAQPLPPGLSLSWPGVADLLSAPTPSGPWRSLGAMNPVWVPTQPAATQFFRLKVLNQ